MALNTYREIDAAKFTVFDRVSAVNQYDVPTSVRVDEADANTTYVGVANVGTATSAAAWQIKRILVSGTVTSIQWADGDSAFNNVWDNRASLSYS